jgi:hypothetical protein
LSALSALASKYFCVFRDSPYCPLFSANGVYDLPFGHSRDIDRNANGFVNALIGGWQFATIFTAHSGFAFSTNTGAFPVGFVFDNPAVQVGSSSALAVNVHDDNGKIQLFADLAAAKAALANPFGGQIGTEIISADPAS